MDRAALIALGLLPAIVGSVSAWWLADPARRSPGAVATRFSVVTLVGALVACAAIQTQSLPTLAVLVVATPIGGYPLVRAWLGRPVPFGGFLASAIRYGVGYDPFTVVALIAPVAIARAGDRYAVIAAFFAVALVVSKTTGTRFRRFAGSTPHHDAALAERLGVLCAALDLPPARVVKATAGAAFARDLRVEVTGSATDVLIGEETLARLDAAEIAAACGLLGVRRRTWRDEAPAWAMFVLAIGVPLLARRLHDENETSLIAWGATGVVALRAAISVAHSKQQRINAPRIVAAFGAAVAARAVTKVYATFWYQGSSERHLRAVGVAPKLPAPLRALVAEADATVTSPYRAGHIAPLVVRSVESRTTFVVFEGDRFHVVDGVPMGIEPTPATLLAESSSRRTFAYEKMRKLRIEAPRWIRAEDASGTAIAVRIAAEDVPRVEAFLTRVGQRTAVDASGLAAPTMARFVALISAVVAVAISWPTAVVGLIVLARPEPSTLAALAGASFAAGVTALSGDVAGLGVVLATLSVIAALHVRSLREALASSGSAAPPRWWMFVALGLAALYFCAAVLPTTSESLGIRLHLAIRDHAWGAVALMGLAGAVAGSELRVVRMSAGVPAVLGVLAIALGSPHVGGRLPGSPFAARLATLPIATLEAAPLQEIEIDDAQRVRLSPDATLFATIGTSGSRRDASLVVRSFTGKRHAIDADEISFLGGRRALTMKRGEPSELRAIAFDEALAESVEWRIEIAATIQSVAVRRDTGQWSAVARTERGDALYSGRIGQSDVETGWLSVERGRGVTEWHAIADGGALAVAMSYGDGQHALVRYSGGYTMTGEHAVLAWTPSRGAATLARPELRTRCRAPPHLAAPAICWVTDNRTESFLELDVVSGAVTPIGALDGAPGRDLLDADQRSFVVAIDRGVVVVDRAARRATQVRASNDGEVWGAALADEHVAVLSMGRARNVVRLYARP